MPPNASVRNAPQPPQPDLVSHFYWDGLRNSRILLQRCESCGRFRFPPMPGCPYCGATGSCETEVSGRGRIYSYVRVHRALTSAMQTEVPYVIAVVELDEGPRIAGRIEDGAAALDIDAPTVPRFVDHGSWIELRFVLSDTHAVAPL